MYKNIAIIMYSHSSYSDAWQMFMGQIDKYFPKETKRYVFVDDDKGIVGKNWTTVLYKDSDSYNERFSHCLESVTEEYCILNHEDMPLYSKPNFTELERCLTTLQEQQGLDYIKLIKGGELRDISYNNIPNIFQIPHDSNCIFAVQPTLWKTDRLRLVYNKTKVNHIREFEPLSQQVCRDNSIHGAYYFNSEPLRGLFHHDSSIYPYVATAIVKGRWNLAEYYFEITDLAKQYDVDLKERGTL
tara:strand:- start:2755 stop:3483 length:729 start_codon:yes stop_codon:yes gene_type:complete